MWTERPVSNWRPRLGLVAAASVIVVAWIVLIFYALPARRDQAQQAAVRMSLTRMADHIVSLRYSTTTDTSPRPRHGGADLLARLDAALAGATITSVHDGPLAAQGICFLHLQSDAGTQRTIDFGPAPAPDPVTYHARLAGHDVFFESAELDAIVAGLRAADQP